MSPARAGLHGAARSSTATVSTAPLLFQPCWLQHHCSDTTKFPSPLPSLMHYLPPGTQDLNESSSGQLSEVQNMLSMEKQHTPEKQKVRDYLAAVYRLLRKSQQSTAKFKYSRHSLMEGEFIQCLDAFQPNSPIPVFATKMLE